LNDVNGNLDAKKACAGALKLHKKYLKKVTCYPIANQIPAIMADICDAGIFLLNN
jgi:hypothetical protein